MGLTKTLGIRPTVDSWWTRLETEFEGRTGGGLRPPGYPRSIPWTGRQTFEYREFSAGVDLAIEISAKGLEFLSRRASQFPRMILFFGGGVRHAEWEERGRYEGSATGYVEGGEVVVDVEDDWSDSGRETVPYVDAGVQVSVPVGGPFSVLLFGAFDETFWGGNPEVRRQAGGGVRIRLGGAWALSLTGTGIFGGEIADWLSGRLGVSFGL